MVGYTARLITRNTVGLYMYGVGDNQPIHYNNVSENQWGAYIYATSPHISHNDFLNNTHSSLYLHLNSAPRVEWNSFSNSATHQEERYGIYVEECSHGNRGLLLSNNTFSYVNESLAIKDSGRDDSRLVQIRDNRFRHSTNSITIRDSGRLGNPLLVRNNNITRNIGGKAIGVYSSIADVEVFVESNSLWNVSVGVYVQSPWVTVEKNVISVWGWEPTPIDSGPRGIYSSSPTAVIGNNTLDIISKKFGWTEVNGIRGTWKLAYNNTVKGYVYGFRVQSTTNPTIRQNHIEGNGAGVRLWGSGVSPLIENNTFVNNVDGVLVQGGASPTVLNNTMSNTDYRTSGVQVSNGTPAIEGNSIQKIGQFGIWVRGQYGNPEILLNTISYNVYGIKIEGGNATIHNSNIIHHNDYYYFVS
ncbi:MAG: right-handed parallel beta-helix repeat-containing protein [Thermoplasmata archaeon]